MPDLAAALAAIDAANAADPTIEDGRPAALIYGERMSAELDRLFPAASDPLRIAARGQHVERWLLPRAAYPEGKAGYLDWRREQGRRHAARIEGIMAATGYGADDIAAAERMLRKEGIKRDPEVQALEDVICFVFLRWYFAGFARDHSGLDIADIVAKTARKMSPEGRTKVLDEFELPDAMADHFRPWNFTNRTFPSP